MLELYKVLFHRCLEQNLLSFQQIAYVEIQHMIMTYALGTPVGVIRTLEACSGPLAKYRVNSASAVAESGLLDIRSIIDE